MLPKNPIVLVKMTTKSFRQKCQWGGFYIQYKSKAMHGYEFKKSHLLIMYLPTKTGNKAASAKWRRGRMVEDCQILRHINIKSEWLGLCGMRTVQNYSSLINNQLKEQTPISTTIKQLKIKSARHQLYWKNENDRNRKMTPNIRCIITNSRC